MLCRWVSIPQAGNHALRKPFGWFIVSSTLASFLSLPWPVLLYRRYFCLIRRKWFFSVLYGAASTYFAMSGFFFESFVHSGFGKIVGFYFCQSFSV
jgi:hypothetical protein